MTSAVLLDLDGTLVDSAPDIHAAASAMLRDLSLPEPPFDETRKYIGDGMPRFIKRMLTRQRWGEPDPALLAKAQAGMRAHYARECTVRRRVYEGVRGTLAALRRSGRLLGCVTNKPEQFTAPVLKACELDGFFGAVVSGDSLPAKKPDPAPLLEACRLLGAQPQKTWMVGDSDADAGAAAAAGCRFAAVAYGYHPDGCPPGADGVLRRFSDLSALLLSGRAADDSPALQSHARA